MAWLLFFFTCFCQIILLPGSKLDTINPTHLTQIAYIFMSDLNDLRINIFIILH